MVVQKRSGKKERRVCLHRKGRCAGRSEEKSNGKRRDGDQNPRRRDSRVFEPRERTERPNVHETRKP